MPAVFNSDSAEILRRIPKTSWPRRRSSAPSGTPTYPQPTMRHFIFGLEHFSQMVTMSPALKSFDKLYEVTAIHIHRLCFFKVASRSFGDVLALVLEFS